MAKTVSSKPKDTADDKPKVAEKPKPKPEAAKKLTPFDVLAAFLAEHSIDDQAALDAFRKCKIVSLNDLLETKTDAEAEQELEKALKESGSKFGIKRFKSLDIESIRNAIFFAKDPKAKETTAPLLDFLEHEGVTDSKDRGKLLSILLEHGVLSLDELRKIKGKDSTQAGKLNALTAAITKWNPAASDSFRKISAAAVARATGGVPKEVDEDLKTFLKEKAKLPPGSEAVLAEYGVTDLQQLKAVREDPVQSKELARELENSGIKNAKQAFEKTTVEEIDEEIGTLQAPSTKEAKKKQTELLAAIDQVKALRTKVEKAAKDDLAAIVADVSKQYDAVVGRVKDLCDVEFEKANTAAQTSQTALATLLNTTIANAEAATNVLKYVDKSQMPLTKLMRHLEMLCGALITPAGIAVKHAELVMLPSMPDRLKKGRAEQESIAIQYRGRQTESFASSYASQTGSSVSGKVDTAAAGFVGSGVGAVSLAGSYADARKTSQDEQTFRSATTAYGGEIRYLYQPKETVQLTAKEIRFGDDARKQLRDIAGASGTDRTKKIRDFYEKFGSHFFTRYSLGGRYEFRATGENTSTSGKDTLLSAVSAGADWATSASGSYLGMGGAVTAAASVVGSTRSARAQGDRLEFSTDSVKVTVSIKVLGGAGIAPRDVWSESLAFNSTWAVIGRAEPIAIWDLVQQSADLPQNLAPVLEQVWVQEIFRNSVGKSNPILFARIGADPKITTCEALYQLVQELESSEPPLEIVIVEQTSSKGEHPKVVAQATAKGLKLIGGGAGVDWGTGPGNMLVGSHPSPDGWVACSKSHEAPSPATVTAYAIYLVDPYDLWDVCRIEAKSQAKSKRPEATAMLPAGYALVGGGALLHGFDDRKGLMLTDSCPVEKNNVWAGWMAKGKDHDLPDEGYATAWVIGIRPKNMAADRNPAPSQIRHQIVSSTPGMVKGSADLTDKKEVILGGGARVTYKGPGAFLTDSRPLKNWRGWLARAKEHMHSDTIDLETWGIARAGALTTIESVRAAVAGG